MSIPLHRIYMILPFQTIVGMRRESESRERSLRLKERKVFFPVVGEE